MDSAANRLLARILLAGSAVLACPACGPAPHAASAASATRTQPPTPVGARRHDTAHFRIDATATPAQARRMGEAAEALYVAYVRDFRVATPPAAPLRMVLYRDRPQFQRFNRSKPWAEAYYLPPVCHAYFDATARNPVHWMLHEATHQLNAEVAKLPRGRGWLDEGLASYYGSSRLVRGSLRVGTPDFDAYPLWWLVRLGPSGNAADDYRSGRVIPPSALLDGSGPPIDTHVNQYYLAYWSFTHFLFHAEDGRHAAGFRQFIATGHDRADFERMVAPLAELEPQWYAYFRGMARRAARESPQDDDDAVLIQ